MICWVVIRWSPKRRPPRRCGVEAAAIRNPFYKRWPNSGVLHNPGTTRETDRTRSSGVSASIFQYTGQFDPLTHEALLHRSNMLCARSWRAGRRSSARQNARSANLETPSITVTKMRQWATGVNGAGGTINCGATCTAILAAGATETLTANPPSNAVFNGWSGACTGNQETCTFTRQRRDEDHGYVHHGLHSIHRTGWKRNRDGHPERRIRHADQLRRQLFRKIPARVNCNL